MACGDGGRRIASLTMTSGRSHSDVAISSPSAVNMRTPCSASAITMTTRGSRSAMRPVTGSRSSAAAVNGSSATTSIDGAEAARSAITSSANGRPYTSSIQVTATVVSPVASVSAVMPCACKLSLAAVRKNRPSSGNVSRARAVAEGEHVNTLASTSSSRVASAFVDDAGPTTASTSCSSSISIARVASPGVSPSSAATYSIGRSRTPPAALISRIARRAASPIVWPMTTPSPLVGNSSPMRSTPSAGRLSTVVVGAGSGTVVVVGVSSSLQAATATRRTARATRDRRPSTVSPY
jgi:hypothetical protein